MRARKVLAHGTVTVNKEPRHPTLRHSHRYMYYVYARTRARQSRLVVVNNNLIARLTMSGLLVFYSKNGFE